MMKRKCRSLDNTLQDICRYTSRIFWPKTSKNVLIRRGYLIFNLF